MYDTFMINAPWGIEFLAVLTVGLAFALSNPLVVERIHFAMPQYPINNPVEDRRPMATSSRTTGDTPKVVPQDPDQTIGDISSLVAPTVTGAFLTQEDVDHLTTELLRVASDLTLDLARSGTAGRSDALMRVDVASRLGNLATIVLDRARTTP